MIRKILILLTIPLLLTFGGAGCTFRIGPGAEGGVFRTLNGGNVWYPLSRLEKSGGGYGSVGNVQVQKILFDDRDSNNVFLATKENGVYASVNGGEAWTSVLPGVAVADMALDSSSRCVLYVAAARQIFKTTDCSQKWNVVFNEARKDVSITAIAVDAIHPETLYATNTVGDILKSNDRGTTWSVIYRLPNTLIEGILIDRWDSNLVYIFTRKGIFRSPNKGVTWEDIGKVLEGKDRIFRFTTAQSLDKKGAFLYASRGSVWKTANGGSTWNQVPFLTSEGSVTVLAAAANPQNTSEIYYATPSTFYATKDNGATWVPRPLPSSRAGSFILVDPYNPERVYLGTQVYKPPSLILF